MDIKDASLKELVDEIGFRVRSAFVVVADAHPADEDEDLYTYFRRGSLAEALGMIELARADMRGESEIRPASEVE